MTLEELEALPENGGFEYREELRDGKVVRRVYARVALVLSDVRTVVDGKGNAWLVGYANGSQYKMLTQTNF